MKKSKLLLLVVPSLFLFSCSRPVIVDTIPESEAIEFINTKYAETEVDEPSLETKVVWKITKDDTDQTASKHINKYIVGPETTDPIAENTPNKVTITEERADAFYSELENPTDKKLSEKGREAVCTLNPTIYQALYHGQGEPTDYKLTFKYTGSGASRGLKITSDYQDPNSIYRRVHTYNKDGHETKFELTVNNGKDLNYTLAINFKY